MNQTFLKDILFLDIETVSQYASFNEVPEDLQLLWAEKTKFQRENTISPSSYYESHGGILAEFSKIVCISIAVVFQKKSKPAIKTRSFYGHDEAEVLLSFSEFLHDFYKGKKFYLCAHNGKEFDYPVLARRYLINKFALPDCLQISGKKPWEVQHIDTMELWKFGDYKHYTSLKLLCRVFGIPSPKDDIDGSQVGEVYWKMNDLAKIVRYCEKDVVSLVQVYLAINGFHYIHAHQIYSHESATS